MIRGVRILIEAVLLVAAGLLALWSLAALGGAVSDRLDVLTHFAPLALAGALAVLLVTLPLARRGRAKRAALALGGAAAVWSFVLIGPELAAASRRDPPASGPALKVVTFNIWGGRNRDVEATADWLIAADADVVLLQEVFGGGADIPRRLRAKYPHGLVCSENRCSLAVLSKHPVRRSSLQRQRWRGPAAKALSVAWAEIDAPGGRFVALTTHYTWPTWVWAQEWQRAELVRLTRPFAQDDLIVTGDFNLTPWSKALREQDVRLGLRRRTRALFSWPTVATRHRVWTPFPLLPIDHVYAGDAWRTVSVERGPRLSADHYPVIVTLARAKPTGKPHRAAGRRAAPIMDRGRR